jgi:hypothetical protein
LNDLEDFTRTDTATNTTGSKTNSLSSLAELVNHIGNLTSTSHTNRVTHRDTRTPLVDAILLESRKILEGTSDDGGEGLIHFEVVDGVELEGSAVEKLGDNLEGAFAHEFLRNTDVAVRDEFGEDGETEFFGSLFGGHDEGRCTVVERGRVGRSDGTAVGQEVRLLRLEVGEVELLGAFVFLDLVSGALLLSRDFDAENVIHETAFLSSDGVLVGVVSNFVLLFTSKFVLLDETFGQEAHELTVLADSCVAETGHQAVNENHIAELDVLHTASVQVARNVGHRFNTTSNTDLDFAEEETTGDVVDGGTTRSAVFVDSCARASDGAASELASSLGDVGRARILHNPAESGVVDMLGINLGLSDGFSDDLDGELTRKDGGETTTESTDGSTNGRTEDDLVGHFFFEKIDS